MPASGYDPSLLLFRRLFCLAKNGDWFTFETSKVDTCLISSMVTTLGAWKDRFFWVSDSIVPFKMVWRHPDAVLNEPEPSESELNDCFLKATGNVLQGKLWDKADRDPVITRSGQVMSALDFVKSDDTSDVVFTNAQAVEGDDTVARGSEQRFEDAGYVSVSNVKGPRLLLLRLRLVSEGQGPDVEKEKKLVVLGIKKASGKKIIVTPIQGLSSKDVEGLSEDEVYVPDWSVKVVDNFKDANVCADVLAHFAPPGVRDAISEMEGDHFISRLMLSSCNLSALVAEGVTRFRKGMQEYEEF
ncbi:hypothetical protein HanIR_Chr13g0651461 [Helianthus annuus]|nr:hypothetical protein HanIR_Chr13g0651461 [Helianthus annuus]